MPKFTIESTSTLKPEQAFDKIKNFLETDKDLRKMEPTLTCTFNTQNLSGEARGSQFKAQIEVIKGKNTDCKVAIHVDLPFLLTPFKSKIEETLQRKLSKALA